MKTTGAPGGAMTTRFLVNYTGRWRSLTMIGVAGPASMAVGSATVALRCPV
jgi:hypothetical protein